MLDLSNLRERKTNTVKPDYKNWVSKGMITGFAVGSAFLLIGTLTVSFTPLIGSSTLRWIFTAILSVAFLICAGTALWCIKAYRAFSYNGKRQLSRQIIEGVADYISVSQGGKILDIGCGSGALAITCAKRNPNATVVGLDRWGKDYASFSKRRCEDNAKAEGIGNTSFISGNAVGLPFPDESYDAVTSNYVYHNIPGKNKQELLLETLRVLKKGGVFAIHDIMSPRRYGDMNTFAERLQKQGYQKAELIDTTNGKFMTAKEAKRLKLTGSAILYGIK